MASAMSVLSSVLAHPDEQVWRLLTHRLRVSLTLLDAPEAGKSPVPGLEDSPPPSACEDMPAWLL
jgi:hypothetical protein